MTWPQPLITAVYTGSCSTAPSGWGSAEQARRGATQKQRNTFTLLPVGMWGRQHELELHYARVVLQLSVLDAVELVGNVRSAHVDLQLRDHKQNHKW